MDDHQEEGEGEPCCTVLLGLMQKDRRRQKRMGQGLLSIGYAVYKVPPRRRQPVLHLVSRVRIFGPVIKAPVPIACIFLVQHSPRSLTASPSVLTEA